MNRLAAIVCLCCGTAMALSAFAQPGDYKPTAPAKPAGTYAQPGTPATPPAMPDMKAMEKAMMEAATPGEMHAFLTAACGTWEGKCKMWMDPSQPAQESTCTTTITSFMGGRFTKGETHGTMPGMDGKPMDFEGFGVYGYNNTTKNFESTWCDNMGTMQMQFTGKLSEDKKTLTWETKYFCPMMHQDTWMREVETRNGPNSMTLSMYGPDPTGKNAEYKMMEISYTRKGDAPMKSDKGKGDSTTKPAIR